MKDDNEITIEEIRKAREMSLKILRGLFGENGNLVGQEVAGGNKLPQFSDEGLEKIVDFSMIMAISGLAQEGEIKLVDAPEKVITNLLEGEKNEKKY